MPNVLKQQLHRHALAVAFAGFTLATLAGCAAQGEMTHVWRDPTQPVNSAHKVLVVAIRKDPVRRRTWEDAFVEALQSRGVSATASYTEMGAAPPDTDQVIESVRRHGYDAVLTSTRLPDEATSRRVPGDYHQEQVVEPYYFGYGRFHTHWASVQDPSYLETDTVIRVETDVWSTGPATGHLVWSGTLRMLESTSGRTVKRAVTEDIMPALEHEGMVGHKVH